MPLAPAINHENDDVFPLVALSIVRPVGPIEIRGTVPPNTIPDKFIDKVVLFALNVIPL